MEGKKCELRFCRNYSSRIHLKKICFFMNLSILRRAIKKNSIVILFHKIKCNQNQNLCRICHFINNKQHTNLKIRFFDEASFCNSDIQIKIKRIIWNVLLFCFILIANSCSLDSVESTMRLLMSVISQLPADLNKTQVSEMWESGVPWHWTHVYNGCR